MIRVSGLRVAFGGRTVLDIDRLDIPAGRFTAILGHNGSGKSTLMSVVARQVSAPAARVEIDGQGIEGLSQSAFARRVAFLPQFLPEAPGLAVRDLCALGRYPWHGAFGAWTSKDDRIVAESMAATGVDGFAAALVDRLSGGERQRAWIAMALAQQARCLLLDEPVSALDIHHQVEVMELLTRLNADYATSVVVVLHDVNLAARYCDHIVALKRGRVAFAGEPGSLMAPARLSHLFDHDFAVVPHPTDGRPVAVSA